MACQPRGHLTALQIGSKDDAHVPKRRPPVTVAAINLESASRTEAGRQFPSDYQPGDATPNATETAAAPLA